MKTLRRSAAAIEAEIAGSRQAIAETLAALERRVSMPRLLERGIEMWRDTMGSHPGRRIAEAVAADPVPLALIAAGLGWKLWSLAGGSRERSRLGRATRRRLDEAAGRREAVGEGPSQLFGLDGAAEPEHRTERVDRGSGGRRRAGTGFAGLAERAGELVGQYPLAVGGVALLAGALAAFALPVTRREDEFLGDARDGLRGAAAAAGRDAVERTARVAGHAAEAGFEAAEAGLREEFPGAQGAGPD